MKSIRLPDSAWEGVEADVEALLDQWLVAPGDEVAAGQPVASVVLVKANLEVSAPAAGRIATLHVAAGESFRRDQALASLQEAV